MSTTLNSVTDVTTTPADVMTTPTDVMTTPTDVITLPASVSPTLSVALVEAIAGVVVAVMVIAILVPT